MPLSPEQELLEHELRVEQMQTNIEKMRADIKQSNRTFMLQFVGVIVAALAAGAALGHYFIK